MCLEIITEDFTMNNELPSKNKWETYSAMKRAQTDAADITAEQLAAQDERERLSRLREPVEAENQEAITQSLKEVEARSADIQEKRNEQHEANIPSQTAESSHRVNNSLFNLESHESGESETYKQETGSRLFSGGHTQDHNYDISD